MLKKFKFEPVRWMTAILTVVTALIGANELVDQLGYPDIIPSALVPYLLLAEAVLAVLLGKAVRARVTPLAEPRTTTISGETVRLVPANSTLAGGGGRGTGNTGRAGMSTW